MTKEQLIAKLSALLKRACSGDREAINRVKAIKTKAAAGHPEARIAHNTMSTLYWQRREGAEHYAKSEQFYGRLLHKDPSARAALQTLLANVRKGDPQALRTFRVLKSIHHKYKASVWSGPGSPRIGGYGMPNIHRAGIDIPGLGSFPTPFDPPRPPSTPVQLLTPEGVQYLLTLIARARTAPPPFLPIPPGIAPIPGGGGDIFSSSNPMTSAFTSTPASTARSSVMSTAARSTAASPMLSANRAVQSLQSSFLRLR
jgi:hypothetical protein